MVKLCTAICRFAWCLSNNYGTENDYGQVYQRYGAGWIGYRKNWMKIFDVIACDKFRSMISYFLDM